MLAHPGQKADYAPGVSILSWHALKTIRSPHQHDQETPAKIRKPPGLVHLNVSGRPRTGLVL